MATSLDHQCVRLKVTARAGTSCSTVEVEVPAGVCDPVDLLPALRSIDDTLVAAARQASEASGRSVTCRTGCGGCCRQLVPLTKIEARWLMTLVASLPDARRAVIRSRFATAISQLTDAGLRDDVTEAGTLELPSLRRLAVRYFRLGIACPFLEQESCSIYSERPLACREYLVTSPSEACETLGHVDRVRVPGRLSPRLGRNDANRVAWIPFVLAPEWVAAHPEVPGEERTGPQLLADALGAQPERNADTCRRSVHERRGDGPPSDPWNWH